MIEAYERLHGDHENEETKVGVGRVEVYPRLVVARNAGPGRPKNAFYKRALRRMLFHPMTYCISIFSGQRTGEQHVVWLSALLSVVPRHSLTDSSRVLPTTPLLRSALSQM